MTEEFLHFVWKYKLFELNDLCTNNHEKIEIIHSGYHNADAGPDFLDARLRIGDTLWAGNIEIHKCSSDWLKHGHSTDRSYDSTILHVVFEDDVHIQLTNGVHLPTLELKNKIGTGLLSKYSGLSETVHEIPCSSLLKSVDPFLIHTWLNRLVVERLETKIQLLDDELERNKGDWEETFYRFMAAAFGFKINADPFIQLARSIPHNLYAKHKNSHFQIEALLFGQAGFLNEQLKDAYAQRLHKEYKFLAHKNGLKPLEKYVWKFLRLRPANFPTIRIAQFADLIYKSNHLFSKILDTENAKKIKQLMEVEASEYWNEHYHFDKKSKWSVKKIGNAGIDLILINVIVPFLFLYGKQKNVPSYMDRALNLLEFLPTENNKVTKLYTELGIKSENALQSQALIELKKFYCDRKKCLNCSIGVKILK
ncbi:DUF2851 family protein [Solitalea koreensis]|uniref:DUF2851 domain-containing protein n=1 Tax=Solitalea koreensis TaxID=543615 RepID=A0A521D966_9SPHI|nr:DUF2851 family protein [Solitalea koreensis]SMO68257.1 Protein of unknown function [Solitalea koreensis]